MKIDWNRIARTAIQSAAGAGIAFIAAINNHEALLPCLVSFASTVAVAVLMNIQAQTKENDDNDD